MGKAKEKPRTTDRQILTDANGKPTHVVLTVEASQDFYQKRDKEELIPWDAAKQRLGLQD